MLKLLKDAFEKKSNENCIKIKKQYLKADLAKLEFESKEALDSGNKILKINNDDVEKQSSKVVKEEYVEYAENDTVKSEPMDQSKVKNEHLSPFEESESKPSIQERRSTRQGIDSSNTKNWYWIFKMINSGFITKVLIINSYCYQYTAYLKLQQYKKIKSKCTRISILSFYFTNLVDHWKFEKKN